MRRVYIAVLASTSGCNAVFDLEPTEIIVDEDRDGVADAVDNCLAVSNPDQLDGDADGLGDACDGCERCAPCERGVGHDEDGDQLDDACDNCPALANADQANADGDELGDVCDTSPEAERRLLFDGFATLGDDWLEGGAQWMVTPGGDVGPVMASETATLQHATVVFSGGSRWAFEAGIVPPAVSRTAILFLSNLAFCQLEHLDTGEWRVGATGSRSAPFTASFSDTLRFRATPIGPTGAQHIECSIPGVITTPSTIPSTILRYPLVPKFATNNAGAQLRYVDLTAE